MNSTYKLFALLIALITFNACNEDPVYYTVEDQPDDMHISASESEIVLKKVRQAAEAITFKWDEVKSPIPTYDSITYAIRLYATDDKANSYTEFMPLGTQRTKTFTTEELNSIIATWVDPGTPLSVTAEVVGTVNNNIKFIKPELSSVKFMVTGYEKFSPYLYIRMTDASGVTKIERLSQRTKGSGVYEKTLNMVPCSYYFSTSSDDSYPAYASAGAPGDTTLAFVGNGAITEFNNTETGERTIVVDANDNYFDCRIYDIVTPPNGFIRIVGPGCSVGWDLTTAEGLFTISNPRYPYIWSWTGQFNSGREIKLALGSSWSDFFFFAPSAGANPADNHQLDMYRKQSEGGDVKWKLQSSGKFTFSVCLLRGKLSTSFVATK